jgi:hypothetical protein
VFRPASAVSRRAASCASASSIMATLGRNPQADGCHTRHEPLRGESGDEPAPGGVLVQLSFREVAEPEQSVIQLIGGRCVRPRLVSDSANRFGVAIPQRIRDQAING